MLKKVPLNMHCLQKLVANLTLYRYMCELQKVDCDYYYGIAFRRAKNS